MSRPDRAQDIGHIRTRIAQAAAKLIAEGQPDYLAAKLKAARQLGVSDKKSLPDNLEIETALREHLALFGAHRQPAVLAALRETALRAMRWLLQAGFEPWLTGATLNGTATEFSAIELELVAVETKTFEMFLLNQNVAFDLTGEGNPLRYEIEFEDATLNVSIFEHHAARNALHPRASLHHARAQLAEATQLFANQKSKPNISKRPQTISPEKHRQ
jgi:hypothetical protein